jgi:uncharacterized protein
MYLENIINKILLALKGTSIQKVILFGSFAQGNPGPDSDVDLLVVTDDRFIPETFKEKMNLKVKISRLFEQIRNEVPVDLIVHTVPMHKKFIEMNSSFKQEILSKGVVIYERNNE